MGSSGVVFTPEGVDGIFTGWFYDPGFAEEYIPYLPIDSDLVLYARGVPSLTFITDPIVDGDVAALEGQPGNISYSTTDSMYYSSVLWDFGEGTTSTDLYATHYYSEPGTYTARLTVYNGYGEDTTTFTIEVPGTDDIDGTPWTVIVAVVLAVVIIGTLIARSLW